MLAYQVRQLHGGVCLINRTFKTVTAESHLKVLQN